MPGKRKKRSQMLQDRMKQREIREYYGFDDDYAERFPDEDIDRRTAYDYEPEDLSYGDEDFLKGRNSEERADRRGKKEKGRKDKGSSKVTSFKKRKPMSRLKKVTLIVLGVLLLLIIAAGAVGLSIRIENITIEGNSYYSDEQVEELLFPESSDYISTIRWLKERFGRTVDVPFVESYRFVFTGIKSARVIVYEKSLIGCINYLGTYMYFDNDGIVVENSTERRDDVVEVTGLDFDYVVVNHAIPVDDPAIFNQILTISQLISINNIPAGTLRINNSGQVSLVLTDRESESGALTLSGVTVDLGTREYLEEKMGVLSDMLSSMSGLSGHLDLSTYDPGNEGHGYIFVRS